MSEAVPTTERLYYDDPYIREFEARVLAVAEGHIVLDRTCFYPLGGGQPGDQGTIGDVEVLDTRKGTSGDVLHIIDPRTPHSVRTGDSVQCALDWRRRFDYMQQHTGQHVLSASFLRVAGLATVSVHQGAEYTTIELDGRELSEDAVRAVEDEANAIIAGNLPVNTYWVDETGINELNLRRSPQVSGRIRIVEIPETDRVACGGVHTSRTGEIGLVRLCAVERIRGRIRYAWYIGNRAHAHHRFSRDTLSRLSVFLSVPAEAVPARVEELDLKLKEAERQISVMQERLAQARAEQLLRAAGPAGSTPRRVVEDLGQADAVFLRTVVETVSREPDTVAVLMARSEQRVMWCVAHGPGGSIDAQAMRTEAFPLVGAKGGGKPPVWQGALENPERFSEFAATVLNLYRPTV
ncbi:MAG: alanyl-tRNA editing protein [Spirochaetaceae bacterium]